MSKKPRHYTTEFKQEAVKLALKSPSISATAKDLVDCFSNFAF